MSTSLLKNKCGQAYAFRKQSILSDSFYESRVKIEHGKEKIIAEIELIFCTFPFGKRVNLYAKAKEVR